MIRHMLVVVALGVALAGCASKKAPQEVFTLAGVWEPVKAELGGEDLPISTFGGATLELTADTYAFAGDRGTYQLLSQLLSRRSAGEMDIHGSEGPNAGHTIPAIYDLNGEELKICYQLGDGSTLNASRFYERYGFREMKRASIKRNLVEVPIVVMEMPANPTVERDAPKSGARTSL